MSAGFPQRAVRAATSAAVIAVAVWLVWTRGDVGAMARQLSALPAWSLAVAVGLLAASTVLYAVRWSELLAAAGTRVRAHALVPAILLGTGANSVLPARAGDLLQVDSVRSRFGVRPSHAFGTLVLERLLDGVAFAVFLAVAAMLLGLPWPAVAGALAFAGAVGIAIALALLAATHPERAATIARAATIRLPARARRGVDRSISGFLAGMAAFTHRSSFAKATLVSQAMWLGQVAVYAVVGEALGLGIPLAGYLLIATLANISLSLPLAPAGLGSYEAVVFFTAGGLASGAETGAAAAYVVVMRGVLFLPVLLAATVALPRSLPLLAGRHPAAESQHEAPAAAAPHPRRLRRSAPRVARAVARDRRARPARRRPASSSTIP